MFRKFSKYCCLKDSNSAPSLDRKDTKYKERDEYIEHAIKAVINKNYEEAEAYLENAQNCDPPFDISAILKLIKGVQPTTEVAELIIVVENNIADEKYEDALTNLVKIGTLDHKVNVSHLYHAATVGLREYNDKLAAEQAKEIVTKKVHSAKVCMKKTHEEFDEDIPETELQNNLIDTKKPAEMRDKETQTPLNVDRSKTAEVSTREIPVDVSKQIEENINIDTKDNNLKKQDIYIKTTDIEEEKASYQIENIENTFKEVIHDYYEESKGKDTLNQFNDNQTNEVQEIDTVNQVIHNNNQEETINNTSNLSKDAIESESGNSSSDTQVNVNNTQDFNDNRNVPTKVDKGNQTDDQIGSNIEKTSITEPPKVESRITPINNNSKYIKIEKLVEEAVMRITYDHFRVKPSDLLEKADRLSMFNANSLKDSTSVLLLKIQPKIKGKNAEKLYKNAQEEFQKENYKNAQILAVCL